MLGWWDHPILLHLGGSQAILADFNVTLEVLGSLFHFAFSF